MKRLVFALAASALAGATLAMPAFAGQTQTGNGAPSGQHYNLNIIAVPKGKTLDPSHYSGHVIFVMLGNNDNHVTTNIDLSPTTDGTFQVIDPNGTDGTAEFALPDPGTYSVWGRAVGTPGGGGVLTTCVPDPLNPGSYICSTTNTLTAGLTPHNGKPKFVDVTTQLTTISNPAIATYCGTSTVDIFNSCLNGYLWQYDNYGMKVLQLRFYYNG